MNVINHYNSIPNRNTETRQKSVILGLKNFNNWIKSIMINKYFANGGNVLDLCCGKGGFFYILLIET